MRGFPIRLLTLSFCLNLFFVNCWCIEILTTFGVQNFFSWSEFHLATSTPPLRLPDLEFNPHNLLITGIKKDFFVIPNQPPSPSISLSTHSFLFVLHFPHLLLSLLLLDGRAEGCYIPDDCHHHRLCVRAALTSQKGSEPASQTAGLWKQMQTAPCPPFTSNCQADFMQTFEMSQKNRMWIRCVFITCVGSE